MEIFHSYVSLLSPKGRNSGPAIPVTHSTPFQHWKVKIWQRSILFLAESCHGWIHWRGDFLAENSQLGKCGPIFFGMCLLQLIVVSNKPWYRNVEGYCILWIMRCHIIHMEVRVSWYRYGDVTEIYHQQYMNWVSLKIVVLQPNCGNINGGKRWWTMGLGGTQVQIRIIKCHIIIYIHIYISSEMPKPQFIVPKHQSCLQ